MHKNPSTQHAAVPSPCFEYRSGHWPSGTVCRIVELLASSCPSVCNECEFDLGRRVESVDAHMSIGCKSVQKLRSDSRDSLLGILRHAGEENGRGKGCSGGRNSQESSRSGGLNP